MKALKYILSTIVLIAIVWGCVKKDEFGSLDFVDTATAPANVTALFSITQDNTGLVTITPNGDGASIFSINFGDGSSDIENIKLGENVNHTYAEGNYDVTVNTKGITGLSATAVVPLVVSFQAPKDVVVDISNSNSVSKQVEVIANAKFATFFEVYFGEDETADPVTANIGETATYVYQAAGTYTIRVVVKGGAVETTSYSEEFVVTSIVQPIAIPTNPPSRLDADVISIFGDSYTTIEGTNYNPNWGQSGSYAEFDLNGDLMLQYINLTYQGIALADGTSIDVSGMEFLHMDIWTADADSIKTSLISASSGENAVKIILTADEWTSVDIPITDYTGQGLDVADIIQLKLDGFPAGAGTVFIDNIYFHKAPSELAKLPIDFESVAHNFETFNGAVFAIGVDPDDSNNPVGVITNAGAGWGWEGIALALDETIDLSVSSTMTMDFYTSTADHGVLLKLEDSNGGDPTELALTVSTTGWSTLSFDLPSTATFDKIVIFVDGGVEGVTGDFYIDNIKQAGAVTPPAEGTITFEAGFETSKSLSSFDGGDMTIIDNPYTTGNSSSKVAKLVKGAGQVWAGSKITSTEAFTFVDQNTVKVKVYSPRVGLNLLMKFEDATEWPNTAASAEITATSTVANEWEELTFDFTGISTSIEFLNLVLIMDNGTVGDGGDDFTIYLDDIVQSNVISEADPINLPLDFETTPVTDDFSNFDGAIISVIDNPQSGSAKVAQIIRDGGQSWAGSKITLGNNIDFSTLGSISMKVFTDAPIGTTVKFKLEGSGGAQTEVDAVTTTSGAWETLTWNFASVASDTYNTLVFMFDFGNVGDGSASSTFLFDDVEQVDLSNGLSQIDLPLDFESTTVDYTMTDFGDNVSSLIVDPDDANNMIVKVIKPASAPTWAGTTMGTNAGFATNIPLTLANSVITIRIWSEVAGTPIRLKVEDAADVTHTCETEVNTTLTGAWETMTFDFTNQATGTELLSVGLNAGWVYNKASIFFNFGTDGATAGEKTYYFDDVVHIN